jgi:hypothetical protein
LYENSVPFQLSSTEKIIRESKEKIRGILVCHKIDVGITENMTDRNNMKLL